MKLRFSFVLPLNEMLNQHVLRFFSKMFVSHSPFTLIQYFFHGIAVFAFHHHFSCIILIVQWDSSIIFLASLLANGISSCISWDKCISFDRKSFWKHFQNTIGCLNEFKWWVEFKVDFQMKMFEIFHSKIFHLSFSFLTLNL